jgi:hypothetical protein
MRERNQKKRREAKLKPELPSVNDLQQLLIMELIRIGKEIRVLEALKEQKEKELKLIRRGYYRQTIARAFNPK